MPEAMATTLRKRTRRTRRQWADRAAPFPWRRGRDSLPRHSDSPAQPEPGYSKAATKPEWRRTVVELVGLELATNRLWGDWLSRFAKALREARHLMLAQPRNRRI
jgi:hypothetical protein